MEPNTLIDLAKILGPSGAILTLWLYLMIKGHIVPRSTVDQLLAGSAVRTNDWIERAKRSDLQVDTLVPAVDKLTGTVERALDRLATERGT